MLIRQILLGFSCLILFSSNVQSQNCDVPSNANRFLCYPGKDGTQKSCEAQGCCWRIPSTKTNQTESISNDLNVPYCYYPSDYPNYNVEFQMDTDYGKQLLLTKSGASFMPSDFLNLTVEIRYETTERLRLKIFNSLENQFQVPLNVPTVEKKAETTDYDVTINERPFSLLIKRKSNGAILFDSSVSPLIFAEQFLQISTRLSSPLLCGLGEHQQRFLLNVTDQWKNLTFWTRDFPPVLETNLYGVHPFHINFELENNQAKALHGQFLLNSNAMDVRLSPFPALTYTSIGGIIDLYIFTGPTFDQTIQQYWDVIGKPNMPPYWSLGFHLSRYGYNTIENLRATIQRMHDADFPFDAQWTDIDAMTSYLDFTYDKINFHELPDLIKSLKAEGKRYVNIIDPAISSTQKPGTYPPFDDGVKQNVFIKKSDQEDFIVGKVWPGLTVFPDFTNPDTNKWWTDLVKTFHDQVPFDGLWIDMNEPSNFVDGSTTGCPGNKYDNPPYVPDVLGGKLSSKTLCPSARQFLSSHYNLHNLYGYFEAQASNQAMEILTQKRPFVLSRSSFAGSGRFTAHWTGDNQATFEDMAYSIPAILSFNLFGIPFSGADICGFGLDTTDELCTRWMQLGAFYPFMRNHNDIGQRDQDPASFPWENREIMKQALLTRYSLMPYWYTLHHEASSMSKAIIRPMFAEYLDDPNTYNIDSQFFVGSGIVVSAVLTPGSTKVDGYFPSDVWFEFPSGVELKTVGNRIELDAPLSKINVHVRGGFIIPTQPSAPNLLVGRTSPFSLFVAPSENGNATGKLFWDDGETIGTLETADYNYFQFTLEESNKLTISSTVRNYTAMTMQLDSVKVCAVSNPISELKVNGENFSNYFYSEIDKVLSIFALNLNLLSEENQTIQWS